LVAGEIGTSTIGKVRYHWKGSPDKIWVGKSPPYQDGRADHSPIGEFHRNPGIRSRKRGNSASLSKTRDMIKLYRWRRRPFMEKIWQNGQESLSEASGRRGNSSCAGSTLIIGERAREKSARKGKMQGAIRKSKGGKNPLSTWTPFKKRRFSDVKNLKDRGPRLRIKGATLRGGTVGRGGRRPRRGGNLKL